MYVRNNYICLKCKDICFAKFIDFSKVTSQLRKFASQFAKYEARIRTLSSLCLRHYIQVFENISLAKV